MNYLSIDTSSKICSITFFCNSIYNIFEEENVYEHSKYLGSVSSKLIKNNMEKINFIALAIGPGSYSGLKIGCSFAKGLAFVLKKPIVPVCTFEGMKKSINKKGKYYISLYSHRDYAFYQLFDSGNPVENYKCKKINKMNKYKIYGYGYEKKYYGDNFIKIKPSSKNLGDFALENYNSLLETNLDNINPIYLSYKDKK